MFNDNTDPMLDTNMVDRLEQKVHMMEELGIDDPITFSSRALIQATFPHSKKHADEVGTLVLHNGNLTITMYSRNGLPYGHYPRLIMCWLTKEAIRRNAVLPIDQARVIPLGDSLNQFFAELGISHGKYVSGQTKRVDGRQIKAIQEHLHRLFNTVISIDQTRKVDTRNGKATVQSMINTVVATEAFYWWEAHDELPYAYVELSVEFFRELIDGAVPLDTVHLAHLKRYPLAIDLYCWATYRISYQQHDTHLTWQQLKAQLGTGYPNTPQGMRNFKKKAKKAIEQVKKAWPEAGIELWDNGVKLVGHTPAVMKKDIPINPDLPPQF